MQSYIHMIMESMKYPVRFKLIQCMTDSLSVIGKLYSSFLVFTLILPWLSEYHKLFQI